MPGYYVNLARSLQIRKPTGPDDPRIRSIRAEMHKYLKYVRVYTSSATVYYPWSSCPTVQAASLCVLSTVSITETSRFLRTDPAQQILEQNVRDSPIASQSSTSHSGSINNGEPEIFMGFFIASLILTNISVLFATTILQYVRHLLHS